MIDPMDDDQILVGTTTILPQPMYLSLNSLQMERERQLVDSHQERTSVFSHDA